jgi:hypothetical protein
MMSSAIGSARGGAAENLDWLSDDSKAPTVLDRAEKA